MSREIRCIPPWVGLPQAHLQLGHVILSHASLSLVLVSLPIACLTYDLARNPCPVHREARLRRRNIEDMGHEG